jgi:GAF domain-containing protein
MEPEDAFNEAHRALADEDLDDAAAMKRTVEVLAEGHPTWSWVGVYLLVGETLILGPFVGPDTEHTEIPVGTGVCGSAVETGRNTVVGDVTVLGNYLACSPNTRSEMVVLIRDGGDIVGEFAVDSDEVDGFTPEDLDALRPLADLAGPRCRRLAAALR